jgi:hypothetical protein
LDRDEVKEWGASPVTKELISQIQTRKDRILERFVSVDNMVDHGKLVGEFRGLEDVEHMIEDINENQTSRREVGRSSAQSGTSY